MNDSLENICNEDGYMETSGNIMNQMADLEEDIFRAKEAKASLEHAVLLHLVKTQQAPLLKVDWAAFRRFSSQCEFSVEI